MRPVHRDLITAPLALGLCLIASAASLAAAEPFDWDKLPAGEWVRLATRGTAAPKVFHGGAAITPERDEVFFFGSDTHHPSALENGESNAVYRLDLSTLEWNQDNEQDPQSSFRVFAGGRTETTSGRPWAMHSFDAVEWDPVVKRVVVVSHPAHTRFSPEKRFPAFRGDWFKRLKPMHWEYDPETKQWTRLEVEAPPLFAHALSWDADRRQLIGHDGEYTYHFDRGKQRWDRFAAATKPGWHLSTVYDTYAGRVLLLGHNESSESLFSYDPDERRWSEVETEGRPLPANGSPIAYDSARGTMLYLANDGESTYNNPSGKAVTFLYDSRTQSWKRLSIASPKLYGMNYLMQYDPVRGVVLHFEKSPESGGRIAVWAFRAL